MNPLFDTAVDRGGIGNMKGGFPCPEGGANLSGAEMDFAAAPFLREALARFARRGLYGFTLPDGPYLDAICFWMEAVRGTAIEGQWILPTLGTVMALGCAIRACTQPGEGVVIHHPSYSRFDRAILRNHRRVVSSPLMLREGRYAPDLNDLEDKLRQPGSRMLLLCNPHNPTGRVLTRQELEDTAFLCRKYAVTVFCDEIFAEVVMEGVTCPSYLTVDRERCIVSTSLGKAFNLTGVNHANLIIPDPQLRERIRIQRDEDHFGSIDPFFYTALCAAYTPQGKQWIGELCRHIARMDELVRARLAPYPVRPAPLEGGFVGWLDMRALTMSDGELDDFMLREARLLADPGWEYGPGGSGHYRINLATTTGIMERAMDGLTAALEGRRQR